jgi:chorismate lyase/3-hydroxybenzoate synthase
MGLSQRGAHLQLRYLSAFELEAHLARLRDRTLGVVAFGTRMLGTADFPRACIDMPVISGGASYEVWSSGERVVQSRANDVIAAYDGQTLFGLLQIDAGDIESAGHIAYTRAFAAMDRLGYPHLLRAWNYFPAITADADGLERYRRFNVGRRDAYIASGRAVGTTAPAACALGCRSGALTLYFLAARASGQPLENPRQLSAYRYPAQYGPTSPTFSRAMLMETGAESALLISGTASIVGHATLHAGDPALQIAETVLNLKVLLGEAGLSADDVRNAGRNLLFKAYLRRPHDFSVVRNALRVAFGETAAVMYLQAEICRPDLLLEIEGAFLNAPIRVASRVAASRAVGAR